MAALSVSALLFATACSSEKAATTAPLGPLDLEDSGTNSKTDGGSSTGDSAVDGGMVGGTGSPVLTGLKADGVYLYGFLRETNDDWQALAALNKPGQAWVGLPFIAKDPLLLGLRAQDGLPVYLHGAKVKLAQADDWSFAAGVPDDVGDNDEVLVDDCEQIQDGRILGRANLPTAFRGAQLVAGSDELIVLCCNGGVCSWRWGDEAVSIPTTLQVLSATDAGYALLAEGTFEGGEGPMNLSVWNRETGVATSVTGALVPDYTVRAVDDGFIMATGPISGFSRWHIGFDGKATKDGDYPPLPGKGERSCQFTTTGLLICIAFSGPGDHIYSFALGEGEPTLLRDEPNTTSQEITLPYVKMTSFSQLVTGTGASSAQ